MLKIIKTSILVFVSLCLIGCSSSDLNIQWAIDNSGKTINDERGTKGIDIDFINTSPSYKTIVAIIDTGFINSPQLTERIFFNKNEIASDGIDNDSNGYVDDISGWNFSNNSCDIQTNIFSSHGTEIAHIIAGNSKEYIGVSSNSLLINIRIDEKDLSPELLAKAILFAESSGAKVVNLSLCLKESNDFLYNVIKNSKMLFVCSAGNDHKEECSFPGKYELNNVVSVGGINSKGLVSSFSNYGLSVDIAAPGEDILVFDKNLNLKYDSGSSLATAYISGISAEMISVAKGNISANKVKEILLSTSKKTSTLNGYIGCGGIVSMKNAINYIIENEI